MIIEKKPYWLTEDGVKVIEEKYGATFMGHWAVKQKDGQWSNDPVDVFYQPNPDVEKGHSKYFGIYINKGEAYVTNAESAFSAEITGVLTENNEVLVSRFRNDFQQKDGAMIDGGRDYTRSSGTRTYVEVKIEDGNFLFKKIGDTHD